MNTTDTTDTTTKGTGTTGVRAGQNGVRAGSQGTAGQLQMPCNNMQHKIAHDCTTTLQHELHVERTGRLRKVLRKVIRKALHGITRSPRLATKRTSKRFQNNPVRHVTERKEAWQEWDWEEDLWDEASEWDEYITIKEWIL